ncbi:MAG: imidazoleglycerol-phosphate dehydratase, partial [Methylococcaceae bacterium]|nr:imidazoleglycerol-phosphate dehydratase [Methylococcaceae bacterium]
MTQRIAQVERNTLETQIKVAINLDGQGRSHFNTGLPFLD